MYNTPSTTQVARKKHVCTWCGQMIQPGDSYVRWCTFDSASFTSKMHPECVDACDAECKEMCENEYLPYDNPRPAHEPQRP